MAGPRRRSGEPPAGLDLDDGRAEIGEQAAGELAGEGLRQLDDDEALERAAAAGARQHQRIGVMRGSQASPNTRAAFL